MNFAVAAWRNADRVAVIKKLEQRLQCVITVRTLSGDV